jgi:hypothetical protein
MTISTGGTAAYGESPDPAYRRDDLILTGERHSLPIDYQPAQPIVQLNTMPELDIIIDDLDLGLQQDAFAALSDFIAAMRDGHGFADIAFGGGCRTGLAFDVHTVLDLRSRELFQFTNPGLFFFQYGHKYGFILRYPEDKEDITGTAHMPWHYRYVGIPHAAVMVSERMTLEEYIGFLYHAGTVDVLLDDEQLYRIISYPPGSDVKVPAERVYRYSTDGSGWTIVTIEY